MVLEQIAISDMVIEPTAQELDYEEYKIKTKFISKHENFPKNPHFFLNF